MAKTRIQLLALVSAALLATPPALFAATFTEDFQSDPSSRGWKSVGEASLFQWNAAMQKLDVTWDSSRPNSYFTYPVGLLTKEDDFSFAFDMVLNDHAAGVAPGKPNPFQLSVALLNLAPATGSNFIRGTGSDSPDLVEFSFFPDPGGAWQWGPSLTAVLCDTTGTNWSSGGFAPLALDSNTVYRVSMVYTASDHILRASVTAGGQDFADLGEARLSTGFTDLQLTHFAICSYSEAGQIPEYAGSILARGRIDNILLITPPPLKLDAVAESGTWKIQFPARQGISYTLERSVDLAIWTEVSETFQGDGTQIKFEDPNAPGDRAFYRVRAQR